MRLLPQETPRQREQAKRPQLQDLTGLTASEINDAVAILSESGLVETFRALGTNSFTFAHVSLTPRGRYEYQKGMRVEELKTEEKKSGGNRILSIRTPMGSPFGFTDLDWEMVTKRTHDVSKLYVVFGHPVKSRYYNTPRLKNNIYNI